VRPGEVVALLGENGAGKSMLSNIIAGTFAPDTESMEWRGAAYAPSEPGDAIAAGIGMIHQELRLLPGLTWPRTCSSAAGRCAAARSTAPR
jgi:ribose transport system ATP-binding protein